MPQAVGRECGTLFRTYNGLPRGRLTHEFTVVVVVIVVKATSHHHHQHNCHYPLP